MKEDIFLFVNKKLVSRNDTLSETKEKEQERERERRKLL